MTVREFTWKSNMTSHLHTHDPNRRKDYVCTYENCKKAFYDAQHLKQHMWTHIRNANVRFGLSDE